MLIKGVQWHGVVHPYKARDGAMRQAYSMGLYFAIVVGQSLGAFPVLGSRWLQLLEETRCVSVLQGSGSAQLGSFQGFIGGRFGSIPGVSGILCKRVAADRKLIQLKG